MQMTEKSGESMTGIKFFKRSVDGRGGWTRITPADHMDPDFGCGPVCFSDISISQGRYVCGVSKENNTVYMCHTSDCNGRNWVLISPEITLTQIDAGAEEVWRVNANNHIFRRPVNGSGEWNIVSGEMRYISASGRDYIWGIAPNDSLYNCEKPCTGDWQYVGGCFRQIDAEDNNLVGVTIFNVTLALNVRGSSSTNPLLQDNESLECHQFYFITTQSEIGKTMCLYI